MVSNQESALNINVEHYFLNTCLVSKGQEYYTVVKQILQLYFEGHKK